MIVWLRHERGDMVEGAITLPLMTLVALALVNLALAGYASVTANNAANVAARVAAVAQVDPVGEGLRAANQSLQAGVGDFGISLHANQHPGGDVVAEVTWQVPNFFAPMLRVFGVGSQEDTITGVAVARFRKEGW